jgi:S1-C subfamily serine protease
LHVTGIGRESPAVAAGLQPHDEIHLVNGTGVQSLHEFLLMISTLPKGAPLTLRIDRYDPGLGKTMSKDITMTNG